MKIIVTNRIEFPKYVAFTKEDDQKWAYISIENVNGESHYLNSSENVLNVDFDDVGEDCQNSITETQGKFIYEFIKSHKDCNMLIHCTAGQSRSQGVARAILDMFPDNWEEDKNNPCLTPNINVVASIKREYYEELYANF